MRIQLVSILSGREIGEPFEYDDRLIEIVSGNMISNGNEEWIVESVSQLGNDKVLIYVRPVQ